MQLGEARELLVRVGRSLHDRGLAHGSAGNLSVQFDDGWLATPTNASLGSLSPPTLSVVDPAGSHVGGDPPTKEWVLHQAVYRARPAARAIVHLHSVHAVAVSCLADLDPSDALPPLTAYYVMRVGRLPLVPYHVPGDPALADAVGRLAAGHHAVLLANHGPVVAGPTMDAAVDAIEELEQTARLHLLLRGLPTAPLDEARVRELHERFPS